MKPYQDRIAQAAALIRGAGRVTAFTGAGISTESGISDFRSPGGVWDRFRIVTYAAVLFRETAGDVLSDIQAALAVDV